MWGAGICQPAKFSIISGRLLSLPHPLQSADLVTRDEGVISQGNVIDAVIASAAIPRSLPSRCSTKDGFWWTERWLRVLPSRLRRSWGQPNRSRQRCAHGLPASRRPSPRRGHLVLRLGVEVARLVSLAQLARRVTIDPVHHPPAPHRRPLG